MSIYPLPKFLKNTGGVYHFSKSLTCFVNPDFTSREILQELWNNYTHHTCELKIESRSDVLENEMVFGQAPTFALTDNNEYGIEVTEKGIRLLGNNKQTLMYAIFTLLQLVRAENLSEGSEAFYISCVQIRDKGEIAFRSIHLCVFPETTFNFLKKAIRLSCFLKYTHIVLEFWGTLKLDVMPELAWEHAFTKDEIRPLIQEANDMGAEVVPMFNHLGHATASRESSGKHVVLDQNPKRELLFEPDGWTWCISNLETLALLRSIRQELIDLFGDVKYFHIGCDEAYSVASCEKCSKGNKTLLLQNYINGVANELKQQGIRAIMWGDALLDNSAWDSPNIATSWEDQKTHLILPGLDRSIIIADWQYYILEEEAPTAKHFMGHGFDVLLSPFDDTKNIEALFKTSIAYNTFGVMATTWHTLNEKLPLLLYASEVAWNGNQYISKDKRLYRTEAAALQRKLMPVKGVYQDAGWRKFQI